MEKPRLTPVGTTAEEIAGELAWCLSRFLDATADENVMLRSKRALALWETLQQSDSWTLDLPLLHPEGAGSTPEVPGPRHYDRPSWIPTR